MSENLTPEFNSVHERGVKSCQADTVNLLIAQRMVSDQIFANIQLLLVSLVFYSSITASCPDCPRGCTDPSKISQHGATTNNTDTNTEHQYIID